MEDYLDAKLRLFRELLPRGAPAVIDADSDVAPRVDRGGARARAARRSPSAPKARRSGSSRRARGFADRLGSSTPARAIALTLPLPGDFQVSNALVAAGLCIATGDDPDAVFAALETLEGAPGRLERVGERPARRSSSTTPTSPTRWRRRSRRCGPSSPGGSSSSSAAAATATPASGR